MAILPKYVHFPGIFLPFLAIFCTHFSYLVKGGGLKGTDEANQSHGGVQMPILQLLQAVHLPES
jgi:hypothetical protein